MKSIILTGLFATLVLLNAPVALGSHSFGLKGAASWFYALTAATAKPQPAGGSFLLTLLPMIIVAIFAFLGVSLFVLTIRSILQGIAARRRPETPSAPESNGPPELSEDYNPENHKTQEQDDSSE